MAYNYTSNGEVYTDFALSWVPGLRRATLYYTRGRAVTFSGGEGAPIYDETNYQKLKNTTIGAAPTLKAAIDLASRQPGARQAPVSAPAASTAPTAPTTPTTPTTPPDATYPGGYAPGGYAPGYYAPQPPVTTPLSEQAWFWPTVLVGGALVLYVVLTTPRSGSSEA